MSDTRYENIGTPIIKAIEECSELIHILCKAERFGLENYHPDDKTKTTNRLLIIREVSDVYKSLGVLTDYLCKLEKENGTSL